MLYPLSYGGGFHELCGKSAKACYPHYLRTFPYHRHATVRSFPRTRKRGSRMRENESWAESFVVSPACLTATRN